MAEPVHYQHEIKATTVSRIVRLVIRWILFGIVGLLLAEVIVQVQGEFAWIFPVFLLVLIFMATRLSWRSTDDRLYFAVCHGPNGATLYVKRILHGKVKHALHFDGLQSVCWQNFSEGHLTLNLLTNTSVPGPAPVLFMSIDPALQGMPIDKQLQDRLAEAINSRADDRWKTLPTEPATHPL